MASRAQRPRSGWTEPTTPKIPHFSAEEVAKVRAALAAYLAEAGYPEERSEWDPEPGCETFVNWLIDNGSGPPKRRIPNRQSRQLSDAGRARIAAAQRRRWALRRPHDQVDLGAEEAA